ncbi:MAG: hypothetical protein RR710_08290 [Oscillospiraceae bacterium]
MKNNDYDNFQQLQLLAWQLLINSKSSELPIRITPIAKLYNVDDSINYNLSRWQNSKIISEKILNLYGLNYSEDAAHQLAVRILCPMCIIKECNIHHPEELVLLCDIPYDEAVKRLRRFEKLLVKNNFYVSELESELPRG